MNTETIASANNKKIKSRDQRQIAIIQRRENKVQTASGIFDPETSTPPSDFMNLLKARMNVYFPNSLVK
jgi:hypothetical protein